MFDHLTLPSYAPIRSFVVKWLQESLLRGDLPRLLQPILDFILAPNTKRIGVVHAHLMRHTDKDAVADIWYNPDAARNGRRSMPDLDMDDLNIIAVSTENGNVAYQRLGTTSGNANANNTYNNNGSRSGEQRQRPQAMVVESAGSGVSGNCGGGFKQKKSPIRTIQKRIFGVSLGGSGGALAQQSGGKLNGDRNNSMSSASNFSVIINPLEAKHEHRVDGKEQGQEEVARSPYSCHGESDSIRVIRLHGGAEVEETERDDEVSEVLSSSAQSTGAVNYLVSGENAVERKPVLEDEADEYDRYEEKLGDEEEISVDEAGAVAADSSLLETNNSDDEESSWQQPQQTTVNGGERPGEDGRSSCDSMRVCSEGEGSGNRFVGDVNFIGDVMSEHDRTKNKKNYSLEAMNQKAPRERLAKEAALKKKDGKKQQRLSGGSKASSDSGSGKSSYRFSDPAVNCDGRNGLSEGMDELLLRNNINWEKSKRNVEILRENNKRRKFKFFDKIHPLHSHMLLYYGVYDTKRVLHCLRTLRNLLANEPRTFLCLTMTTSVADSNVKGLLIR